MQDLLERENQDGGRQKQPEDGRIGKNKSVDSEACCTEVGYLFKVYQKLIKIFGELMAEK